MAGLLLACLLLQDERRAVRPMDLRQAQAQAPVQQGGEAQAQDPTAKPELKSGMTPKFEEGKPNNYPQYYAEAKAALADLKALPPDRAYNTFYLTIAAVAENSRKDFLPVLSFALNSTSFRRAFVHPTRISKTLLRLDVEELQWPHKEVVKMLAKEPYFQDMWLGEVGYHLATCSPFGAHAVTRADWLLAEITREPSYSALLALGDDLKKLEDRMVLNREKANTLAVHHGGRVFQSQVAKHNRAIEWLQAAPGSWWQTTDTFTSSGKASVLANLEQVEEIAGGELIGQLPNKLHWYTLVNAQGKRIPKADADVARDTRKLVVRAELKDITRERLTDDVVIYTGFSCMGCHGAGLRPYTDVISKMRDSNQLELRTVDKRLANFLADFYDPVENARQLAQDNIDYEAAVVRCTGKRPLEAANQFAIFQTDYTYEPVDLNRAAAELGIPAKLALSRFKASDAERLRILGLFDKTHPNYDIVQRALTPPGSNQIKAIVAGESIPRDAWEEVFPEAILMGTWAVGPQLPDDQVPKAKPEEEGKTQAARLSESVFSGKLQTGLGMRKDQKPWEVSQFSSLVQSFTEAYLPNATGASLWSATAPLWWLSPSPWWSPTALPWLLSLRSTLSPMSLSTTPTPSRRPPSPIPSRILTKNLSEGKTSN